MTFAPPSTPITAVAFDLDGTMINTEDLYEIAGQQLVARRGHQMTDSLRNRMIGRPAVVALQLVVDEFDLADTAAELLDECEAEMQILIAEQLKPMPGLFDLLNQIKTAAIPNAIATSGVRSYAKQMVQSLDITHHFNFLLTAEDVVHGKPAPDVFQLAAQRHGVEPEQLMVLEDSGNGCRAAVDAGAYTVAVPNRHTQSHDFSGAGLIANSLADERILRALGI